MADDVSALTQYVESRTGDAFRAAIKYNGSEYEIVNIRNDISEDKVARRFEIFQPVIEAELGAVRKSKESGFEDLHATLHAFKEYVFMNFPLSDSRGIIISMDAEVSRNLSAFINQCLRQLHSENPLHMQRT